MKYPKKADPKKMLEKINELMFYMSNNVKIYFYDQKIFFLNKVPNHAWATKDMVKQVKAETKTKKKERIELNFCVSFDRIEGMMLVNGATTKAEFVKMMHTLISRDENFARSKSQIFQDNANWNNEYYLEDYLQSDYPQCFNAPYASPLNFVEYFFKPIDDKFIKYNDKNINNFMDNVTRSIYDGILDDFGGLLRNYMRELIQLKEFLISNLSND